MIEVTVRVYGPLNDFLPSHRRQVAHGYFVRETAPHWQLVEATAVGGRFGASAADEATA